VIRFKNESLAGNEEIKTYGYNFAKIPMEGDYL
jgi:hypothetical protein